MAKPPSQDAPTRTVSRVAWAGAFLLAVILVGAGGYDLLGGERWTAMECLYMAVITISTVGYAETLPGLHDVPGAMGWTMGLIVLGSGSMLYFASALTALIVEGDLGGAMRRRRMTKRIEGLEGHIIVCGAGATGRHVLDELAQESQEIVVVDRDPERLAQVDADFPRKLGLVEGDATEDAVLEAAGILHASGLVLALTEDRDNVYAAVSARALAPTLRIVAKGVEPGAAAKLRRAGADEVVSPSELGGRRLATRLLRPTVHDFFTQLLGSSSDGVSVEQVTVPADSRLIGNTLSELALRERVGVMVIGVGTPDGKWVTRPGGKSRLGAGDILITIGDPKQITRLRQLLTTGW